MIEIKYIGKKDRKEDNIARTGVVWLGNGDVQKVPDSAVSKLLEYPDIWVRANAVEAKSNVELNLEDAEKGSEEDGEIVEGEGAAETEEQSEEEYTESDNAPLADLSVMDVNGLRDYAQRNFGHEFPPRTRAETMRDQIVGLMNRG